jgi:hypothetical protein
MEVIVLNSCIMEVIEFKGINNLMNRGNDNVQDYDQP